MRIVLIGCGYWGKILLSKLKKFDDVKITICSSKDNWKIQNMDWAFIATPNEMHYDQVKYYIEKGVNVFCEKPLTTTFEQSKELFDLAKKYNVKLYVDDVFNYRTERKDIKDLKKPINVIWNKVSDNTLYDLLYHDLYLLWPYYKYPYTDIKFTYGTSDDRMHKINHINLSNTENSNDALLDMIKEVLYGYPDYVNNKKISLMCNKVIDKLQKEEETNEICVYTR